MDRDFKKDRSIDPDELDIEWLDYPNLVWFYHENVTVRKKKFEICKTNLDVIKSTCAYKIRKNPTAYGASSDKVTVSELDYIIQQQKKFIKAQNKLISAKYKLDLAVDAANAIDRKKSTLENLVKLLSMDYFSSPTDPRNLSEEVKRKKISDKKETARKAADKVKNRQNNKKLKKEKNHGQKK